MGLSWEVAPPNTALIAPSTAAVPIATDRACAKVVPAITKPMADGIAAAAEPVSCT